MKRYNNDSFLKSLGLLLVLSILPLVVLAQSSDPLASWNDGAAKQAIIGFVQTVTDDANAEFVPPAERIAVFDNDGTLWGEQPLYFQLLFVLDRVREMAPKHPEWKEQQPFKAVLEDDHESMAEFGKKDLVTLLMTTHAGISPEEFQALAAEWLASAKHPKTGQPYVNNIYQPMLELLAYLRANDFKTYIVSGGGIEFVRAFAEEVYGIPPEQVVGSSIKTKYEESDGKPNLVRLPEMNFIDDKEGKPVAINQHIGRRPIAAFGNSDGDLQMLKWTAAGDGARFMLLVHHDDAEREYAYDRQSKIGKLEKALDEAKAKGWTVVSMKNDWQKIFPFSE